MFDNSAKTVRNSTGFASSEPVTRSIDSVSTDVSGNVASTASTIRQQVSTEPSQPASPVTAPAAPAVAPSIATPDNANIHAPAVAPKIQGAPQTVHEMQATLSAQIATGSPSPAPTPAPAQITAPAPVINMAEARPDDRRDADQARNRAMGYVISCDGGRVVIRTVADLVTEDETTQWAIGRLISINMGKSRIVGLIYKIESTDRTWNEDDENPIIVRAELQGEVFDPTDTSEAVFRKGISNYPHAGAIAHRIRVNDLKIIYEKTGRSCASVGMLSQDETISANINVDELISKHFAILGSTGSGKSSATSLILHRIQENSPGLRILILDPHNEYTRGFRDTSATIDLDTFDLPHWMFQLDEFAEVLFRGNPAVVAEREALRELIPAAKVLYSQNQEGVSLRKTTNNSTATADSPVPYRISDLLSVIEDQIGLLDSTMDRPTLKSLKNRIDSLKNDSRFRFMFSSRMITDNAMETLGKIFRIPSEGKPISILQMAEIPSEVVSSLVSVICRLAFDLTMSSAGRLKILVVCEEAHRYIPDDKGLGFAPTRQAIARIAKEGRKYGTYLCIISQRPGELDATILSQCSTVFALRLSNEVDQDIVRKAISASSASTISFLSSIGNREAIAFGEGLATPMRLRFSNLPNEWLLGHDREDNDGNLSDADMLDVLTQWKRVNQQ